MIITTCTRCGRLVGYNNSSDAIDGHRCPDGSAQWIEELKSEMRSKRAAAALQTAERTPSPSGRAFRGDRPLGEDFSELDAERSSLEAIEPEPDAAEVEMAEVIEIRRPRCSLCGGLPKLRWDKTDPLTCSGCGAGINAGASA